MVKAPEPVQPVPPVSVQVPLMVLPVAVPVSLRVFPDGLPEATVNPKLPLTLPLKLPLRVKEPLSVSPDTKQGELVVKLKLEMVSEPSPLTARDVPKLKTVVLFVSRSVAFHVPLIFPELLLLDPQPAKTSPSTSSAATASRLIVGSFVKCDVARRSSSAARAS